MQAGSFAALCARPKPPAARKDNYPDPSITRRIDILIACLNSVGGNHISTGTGTKNQSDKERTPNVTDAREEIYYEQTKADQSKVDISNDQFKKILKKYSWIKTDARSEAIYKNHNNLYDDSSSISREQAKAPTAPQSYSGNSQRLSASAPTKGLRDLTDNCKLVITPPQSRSM
jgi:hypothetical protein